MTITKFHPARSLMKESHLPPAFHSIFDSFFNDGYRTADNGFFTPRCDVWEESGTIGIDVSLPGFRKEDIRIEVKNDVLNINGERKMNKDSKDKRYHRVENAYGSFSRSFQLPENIVKDAIQAEFKDGILNIVLPKSAESGPRPIEIK